MRGEVEVHELSVDDIEEQLASTTKRLELLLETAAEGVWIVDAHCCTTFVNERMAGMLGYSVDEMLGTWMFELMADGTGDGVLEIAERPRGTAKGRSEQHEFKFRSKNGSDVWTLLSTAPILNRAGVYVGALAMVTDITAQKAAEKERQQAEARLRLAERMASIGTMAAGVAHEINNPLAFMLGNIELVVTELSSRSSCESDPPDDDRVSIDRATFQMCMKALEEARAGANRVRTIVRDLKTFAREADNDDQPTDPRDVLRSSLTLARNEIRHSARIVERFDDVPKVLVSESRLGQVLLNLIVNAAQAMAAGGQGASADSNVLDVSTSTDTAGWAVIEVRDTGSGIPAAHLARIFDPFFTTKPIGTGTGLGLSICHGIVTEAGGQIEVDSKVGVGTTMRVRLPPAHEEEAPPALLAPPPAPPAPPAAPETPSAKSRILLIDDEPLVISWIRRVLRQSHQVTATSSGHEAIGWIERGDRFDLIICDLMMPEMTGMDVHAAIERCAPEQADRMVFASGGAFTDAAREFMDSRPLEARLEKPFTSEMLAELVATRLAQTAAK